MGEVLMGCFDDDNTSDANHFSSDQLSLPTQPETFKALLFSGNVYESLKQ